MTLWTDIKVSHNYVIPFTKGVNFAKTLSGCFETKTSLALPVMALSLHPSPISSVPILQTAPRHWSRPRTPASAPAAAAACLCQKVT